jgi:chromosome segregation ATPase
MQPIIEETNRNPAMLRLDKENQMENMRIPVTTIPTHLKNSSLFQAVLPINNVHSIDNECEDATGTEPKGSTGNTYTNHFDSHAMTESQYRMFHSFSLLQKNLDRLTDLNVSNVDTEETKTTVTSFNKIVESATRDYHERSKEPSKLSQVRLDSEESKPISLVDALTAALVDMMDMQHMLLTAERRVADLEAKVASYPVNERKLLSHIETLQDEVHTSQTTIDQLTTQKQHIIVNMKKKKLLLDDMGHKLAVAEHDLQHLSAEKNKLNQNLQTVTESRDSLKNKIRNQQEVVKDAKNCMLELKQRLQKTEQMRALENDLLDNFRKLAIHTG